uniref:Uncharacterized protein n=1 Tax=Sparus aurata TaxID=8175 RepID=A0A671VEB1_SPAAU
MPYPYVTLTRWQPCRLELHLCPLHLQTRKSVLGSTHTHTRMPNMMTDTPQTSWIDFQLWTSFSFDIYGWCMVNASACCLIFVQLIYASKQRKALELGDMGVMAKRRKEKEANLTQRKCKCDSPLCNRTNEGSQPRVQLA